MEYGRLLSLPNLVTFSRILAVLPIAWLIDSQHYVATFWVVFAAGMTDAIDGWLAKRFGQQSHLGSMLDPLADKVLLFGCFALMAAYDLVPMWLFLLVTLRDVVIVSGALAYHRWVEPFKAKPTWTSKITTFMQIILVLLVFADLAMVEHDWAQITTIMIWLVSGLTVVSGLMYVWIGGVRTWQTMRHR